MHVMVFLRAAEDRKPEAFKAWYLDRFAPRRQQESPELRRHIVNLTVEGPAELRLAHDSTDPRDRYDVVAQMWFADEAGYRAAMARGEGALREWTEVLNAYSLDDTVILDREPPRAGSLPGFKLLRELLLYADMSDAAARRCWAHHAKLALKVHVGMTRYVQHWVAGALSPGAPPTRGISELYFPTREELVERYYESPRGRDEIVHDTGHFIERRLPRVYSHEHVLMP